MGKIKYEMNIQEIIIKENLTQEEVFFVIQEYIFEKKGIRVEINLLNNPMFLQLPRPMFNMVMNQQFQLMDVAYQISCEYFFEKLENSN